MFRDCLLYIRPGLKMGHQDWSPDLQKFTGQVVKHNTCVWRSPHTPPPKRSVSWVVHGQFHWSFSKGEHAKVHGQNNFWHQISRRGRLPNTGNKLGWERLSNEPNWHRGAEVEPGLQTQLSASAHHSYTTTQEQPLGVRTEFVSVAAASHGVERGAGHH